MPRRAPGEKWACAACGAELIAAQSSTNEQSVMPIELAPHENGNVLLQQRGGTLVAFVFGDVVTRQILKSMGVVMRVSHFATCPEAESFRGGRKES